MRNVIRLELYLGFVLCAAAASPAMAQGGHAQQDAAAKPEVAAEQKPEAPVLDVLSRYQAAMEARSMEKLAEVMHPDVLVLEGIYKNVGWLDYRDNHIGPEMKEWKEFKTLRRTVIEASVNGDAAYAVQEATYSIVTAEKTMTLAAAETFVLQKGPEGWKIKHVHFSGKRKPMAAKP
ncbi:MAG: nuclear transport factor 2 family protein [Elusimicrobia bacterium]|nr:nuclear transport factor 2 family protein [Elusimicrobiota bacterium]